MAIGAIYDRLIRNAGYAATCTHNSSLRTWTACQIPVCTTNDVGASIVLTPTRTSIANDPASCQHAISGALLVRWRHCYARRTAAAEAPTAAGRSGATPGQKADGGSRERGASF